jgi:transposase
VPPGVLFLADRGYDTDAVRAAVNSSGATPNIPPKTNSRFKPPFSPVLYRARNAIERMFGRLKDFRRITTRYDKLATNFLAAVHLTAAVCNWL